MMGRLRRLRTAVLCAILAALGMAGRCSGPEPMDRATMDALYAASVTPPERPLRVYHLGHSLVGHDMPVMLEQLVAAALGPGHRHESQLGWGASLKAHWEPDEQTNGFAEMNDHDRHRPAMQAVASGDYDAVVLTEMVEIRAAIKYFDSGAYLARWAARAMEAEPEPRVYLYESWHNLDDPDGWLTRLDADLGRYWEDEILARALNGEGVGRPIYMIPAGQVMAAFVRALEARGGIEDLTDRTGLFARSDDGTLDTIHLNDRGAYLVALTHYAVLYGRSPVGLPHMLTRADGSLAETPGPEAARLMQEVVRQVVTTYPKTGVPGP